MKLDYNRIDPELREGATEELALRVDRAGLNALREATRGGAQRCGRATGYNPPP